MVPKQFVGNLQCSDVAFELTISNIPVSRLTGTTQNTTYFLNVGGENPIKSLQLKFLENFVAHRILGIRPEIAFIGKTFSTCVNLSLLLDIASCIL